MIIVIVIIILFSRELGRSTDIALPIHSSTKKATSKVSRGARDGSAPIAPPPPTTTIRKGKQNTQTPYDNMDASLLVNLF